MKILEIILGTVWAFAFISIGAILVLSHMLFNALKEKYPKYYTLIGRPEVSLTFVPNLYSHPSLKEGQAFVFSLINSGIPTGFPKDSSLRRRANIIRLTWLILIPEVIVFFAVMFTLALKYGPNN